MATLVFDTSGFSALASGHTSVLAVIDDVRFERFLVPLAVDAELRFWYKHGTREADNLLLYAQLIQDLAAEIIAPDEETSKVYAELATWSVDHGAAMTANDLWVAAAAVQYGAELLTFDVDFSRLPQVRVVPGLLKRG